MTNLFKNLERFKLITFDCTNTLFYFKKSPALQYIESAEEAGVPKNLLDKDLVKVNFRKQFKELNQKYPNFGKDSISYHKYWEKVVVNVLSLSSHEPIPTKLLETVALKLIHQYKTDECWGKFSKADQLITALKEAGKSVGVISNFDPRLHELIVNMKLPKLDFVLTSYEEGVAKPDREIFEKARKISHLDIKPSEALHIGNELEKDFYGAKNAGWSAILISSTENVEPQFKDVEELWRTINSQKIVF